MFDLTTTIIVLGTFLVGGAVKGMIGLGLPTLSLAVLAIVLDLHTAMALVIVPALFTNIWQAFVGGNGRAILRRLWPFLLTATAAVWFGALALTRVELAWLSALLGTLLIFYAGANLSGFRFDVSRRHEKWTGMVFGSLNGLFTGMTGSAVVPGVMFLQAIGLSKDLLVQAMGITFVLSTVALAFSLTENHLLNVDQATLSLLCVVPAGTGMALGQAVRNRLSEQRFRKIFFLFLIALGSYILVRAAMAATH